MVTVHLPLVRGDHCGRRLFADAERHAEELECANVSAEKLLALLAIACLEKAQKLCQLHRR